MFNIRQPSLQAGRRGLTIHTRYIKNAVFCEGALKTVGTFSNRPQTAPQTVIGMQYWWLPKALEAYPKAQIRDNFNVKIIKEVRVRSQPYPTRHKRYLRKL